MSIFDLMVRYSRELSDLDLPCHEEHFVHGEMAWTLPKAETGLVLVDCWDKHPVETHLERGGKIAKERILPVVKACREAGIAVIHAPSPQTAEPYPQWTKYAESRELHGGSGPGPEWPPKELRWRTGEYEAFARPKEKRHDEVIEMRDTRRIMDFLGPEPDDFVVATGAQLHRLCHHQGLKHLFYAGFAANICVQRRDYGVWAMLDRGYNIVLLRDCTTAIEHSTTWDGMWLTEASILDMELRAASSTSDDLLEALKSETR